MSNKEGRLYEFRIEYTSDNSISHNYHYYLAHDAKEALKYQQEMMNSKHLDIKLVALEKKCPYSNKWEDESSILNPEA
jgi:hypothetical protein